MPIFAAASGPLACAYGPDTSANHIETSIARVDVESRMRLDVAWLHAGTRHLTREFGREVKMPSCHAYSVWWGQRPALPFGLLHRRLRCHP